MQLEDAAIVYREELDTMDKETTTLKLNYDYLLQEVEKLDKVVTKQQQDFEIEIEEWDKNIGRITQEILGNEDDFFEYRNETQATLLGNNINIESLTKTILQLDDIIDEARDV